MLTKKVVFRFCLAWSAALVLLIAVAYPSWCSIHNWCYYLLTPAANLGLALFLPPVVLVFFWLSSLGPPRVYERWAHFSEIAAPVVFVCTLLLSSAANGSFYSSGFNEFVAAVLFGWYALHSAILILGTTLRARSGTK